MWVFSISKINILLTFHWGNIFCLKFSHLTRYVSPLKIIDNHSSYCDVPRPIPKQIFLKITPVLIWLTFLPCRIADSTLDPGRTHWLWSWEIFIDFSGQRKFTVEYDDPQNNEVSCLIVTIIVKTSFIYGIYIVWL